MLREQRDAKLARIEECKQLIAAADDELRRMNEKENSAE